MTREVLQKIRDALEGTPASIESVLDKLELLDVVSIEEVEEGLLDLNLERCKGCDWWFESGELVNGAGDVVGCGDCRGKDEEE